MGAMKDIKIAQTTKRDRKQEAYSEFKRAFPAFCRLLDEDKDYRGLTISLKDDGWLATIKAWSSDGTPVVKFAFTGSDLYALLVELNRIMESSPDSWKPDKYVLDKLVSNE